MITKIKSLFGLGISHEKKFIDYILELERQTPNNYQFGSLMRQKMKDYQSGKVEFKKNNKIFSH